MLPNDPHQPKAAHSTTLEILQATLDSSLDMIQVFEAVRNSAGTIVDFTYILVNHEASKWIPDAVGKSLLQLQPGVVQEGIFDAFVQVAESGIPQQYEKHYVHEQFNGWYHQSVVKLGNGVATTTADITARKKAEEDLRLAKQGLQATLDSSPYVIQAFKAVRNEEETIVDFTWIFTNNNWNQLYGDVIGKSLLQQNPGVVETGLFEKFVQVTETGISIDQEQYYSHEQFHDQWFHQTLVKMGDGFVMNTEDITEQKRSQAEILRLKDEIAQKATDKYQTLFNSIGEGFAIQEVVTDKDGNATDVIYLEVNGAFEQISGLKDVRGKKASEVLPHLEQHWLDTQTQVYQTGKLLRGENYSADLGRWITYQFSRIGGAGSPLIAAVFNDITERKRREQQQEYLLHLNDALRSHTNPIEIQRAAMQVLGEHLQVDRIVYSTISLEEDYFEIHDNYATGSVQKITGRFPFSAFGDSIEKNKKGENLVIDDVRAAVKDEKEKAQFFAMNVHAVVAVPLIKKGKLVMNFSVHQTKPRQWRNDEVALIRETAERTWAAVERAKAEAALRESEEKYRTLFETIEEGFCIMELVRNEQGNVVDVIYREVNKAFERHTGLTNVVGKRSTDTIPNQDPDRFKLYQRLSETGETTLDEVYINDVDRWLRLYRMRLGGAGSDFIAAVFEDITERKRREANLAFLAEISLDFAPLLTVQGVMEQVVERLAHHFQLSRCHLSIVDEENDSLEMVYEYRRNKDLPSIMGTHHVLDNLTEEGRKHFKAGKLAVVDSAQNSWLRKTPAELLQQFGFGSLLDVPHLEGGRWKFLLTLARLEPGGWRKDEMEMLEELSSKIFIRIERARAEEALRNSEERLQSITDLAPDLLWDSEPDGSTSWYNQRWFAYTGQSFEEATGWGWIDVIHPDDREISAQRYHKAVEKGEQLRQEHRIRRYDGVYHWFLVNVFPHKDESGQVVKVYGAATDIHETRLMHEALRESEKRLRTLADAVPQLIWTNEANGRANYFNQRWYEFSGLSYKQSEGLGWQAIVHPDDAMAAKEKWRQSLAAGAGFEMEYRLRRHDGSFCWFIGRTVPLRNEAGNITGWFGTATDIENLKKAEAALSQNRARLRITMESATDYAIISMDMERKVEQWSQGAMELFQYTEEEIKGRSADLIFTDEDKAKGAPQQEMETARNSGRAADERWHQRKDGSRFFASGVMRPIQENGLTGYVKVLRDVTEQQMFTEELHRLVAERTLELQRSNEDLQQFASIASHDLQEPLRKLQLFANLLVKRHVGALPEDAKSLIRKMTVASDRMRQLIREVLEYSKIAQGTTDLVPTELEVVLHQLLNDLELLLKDKGATIELGAALPVVNAVPRHMYQLFYNLITNALKFAQEGVPPVISITSQLLPPEAIKQYAELRAEVPYLEIVVTDNGIGFEQQYAGQIFQLFERLHSPDEYEGTGIGLALCKKIVENHFGHIYATSSPGNGASFHIILPLMQPAEGTTNPET